MRAPSRSFRAEIAAYRDKLVADNDGHPQLQAWMKVLDNWSRHLGAEDIWTTLKEKLPTEIMLTEEEFIFLVLDRRFQLERLNNVIGVLPAVERQIDHQEKRNLKEKNRRRRAFEHARLAHANVLLTAVTDQSASLLGREKKNAVRNLFIIGWRDKFRELCGQPLDEVVRVLTEIAFDQPLTIDAVRGVQKSPPVG
jgi:hypothetical protein